MHEEEEDYIRKFRAGPKMMLNFSWKSQEELRMPMGVTKPGLLSVNSMIRSIWSPQLIHSSQK